MTSSDASIDMACQNTTVILLPQFGNVLNINRTLLSLY